MTSPDRESAPAPVRSDPVKPGARLTEDGRPVAEVRSYARRGSRLTAAQHRAWDAHAGHWVVPAATVVAEGFDQERWFGRSAPLVVEVGSGTGEAATARASAHPDHDLLAVEVWRPGVAQTLLGLERAGVDNVRVLCLDAAWVFEHALRPGTLAEVWTFFPDPWHKSRHHKRRLVSPAFATLVASRLASGGVWRLATDWSDYAAHIEAAVGTVADLSGGRTPHWEGRPSTKFERRGLREGREVVDLCYRREDRTARFDLAPGL